MAEIVGGDIMGLWVRTNAEKNASHGGHEGEVEAVTEINLG